MKQERASNSSVDEGEDEPAELELDASVGDSIEPAQRMTLLQRVEAVEAFAGFIFALIFTAAAGLVGIALIA